MRLVRLFTTLALVFTSAVSAEPFKIMDDAPVYWDQRNALSDYLLKSGECLVLSRIGDSPSQYPRQVKLLRDKFRDDKTRQYIPFMTYSCMVTGYPVQVRYIPERYLNKL